MAFTKQITLIVLVVFGVLIGSGTGFAGKIEQKVLSKRAFFKDHPAIKWVKVEKENVVIGWQGIPKDFTRINRKAAIEANLAYGRKIHVWSVRHRQKNWVIGSRPYLCKTTAKNGKVFKTTCKF